VGGEEAARSGGQRLECPAPRNRPFISEMRELQAERFCERTRSVSSRTAHPASPIRATSTFHVLC